VRSVNGNRGIGLFNFSHVADQFAQNTFEWCTQITVKTKISSHCAPPRNRGLIAQFEERTPTCT
jgi:hypothetical protein